MSSGSLAFRDGCVIVVATHGGSLAAPVWPAAYTKQSSCEKQEWNGGASVPHEAASAGRGRSVGRGHRGKKFRSPSLREEFTRNLPLSRSCAALAAVVLLRQLLALGWWNVPPPAPLIAPPGSLAGCSSMALGSRHPLSPKRARAAVTAAEHGGIQQLNHLR